MLKRILSSLITLSALLFFLPEICHATCQEVSISTCVGDFANGGDNETGSRLLGNTSGYSLGFLEANKVRIFITSGTNPGQVSSAPTAGYVGIWTDGISQFPKFHLDVWGNTRTTGTLILGTTVPTLTNLPNYYFLVENGTASIMRNGNVGINTLTPTSRFEVKDGSATINGGGLRVTGDIKTESSITFPDGSVQTSAGVGAGSVGRSTSTWWITTSQGPVFLSTITNFGAGGSTFQTGPDTYTISKVWGSCAQASSMTVTVLKIAYSTTSVTWGGQLSYLWPDIHIASTTAIGPTGNSLPVSSRSVVGAWVTLGVVVSSMNPVGAVAQDCKIGLQGFPQTEYNP